LAELLTGLSQVSDIGMGQPPDTALRTCVVATRLAGLAGADAATSRGVYYTAMLQHVGCTAYAHETAALLGGDDIALRASGALVDTINPREAIPFLLFGIARGASIGVRVRSAVSALRLGPSFDAALSRANCEVALRVARRIRLPYEVQEGLDHIYERWDGKGHPAGLRGARIAAPARFTHVATQAVMFHDAGGTGLALETIRRRSGSWLDPDIAQLFLDHGSDLLTELDAGDPAVMALDMEPESRVLVPDDRLDEIARAFGDLVDVKSPYMHGHSAGVSRIAGAAASHLGLPETEIVAIRRAGWLHDLGHAGIPNGIWEKPGPLTSSEWEQVRLHPYFAERMMLRSPVLAPLAPLVGMHHDRQDGSGYHHHTSGQAVPMGSRIIAAADVYQAMQEPRPHRAAHSREDAARQLYDDAIAGRLDREAVSAVLTVAGHEVRPTTRNLPAGLTGREIEVLRLAARGVSTREIGTLLSISPKTADHHIQHIYAKIGVRTRAGAAMFAMEHDLISGPVPQK
jgi:HD-GYP domain-containing protein (c-di-GMP phosphodiesterase class II)